MASGGWSRLVICHFHIELDALRCAVMSVKSDRLKADRHAKGLNGRVWDVSDVFMLEAKRQLLLGADVQHAARAARCGVTTEAGPFSD